MPPHIGIISVIESLFGQVSTEEDRQANSARPNLVSVRQRFFLSTLRTLAPSAVEDGEELEPFRREQCKT
jgi:hypothetical protein